MQMQPDRPAGVPGVPGVLKRTAKVRAWVGGWIPQAARPAGVRSVQGARLPGCSWVPTRPSKPKPQHTI